MPIPFFIVCFLILLLGYIAFQARWRGWGLPMGAVLATVGTWYVGDVLYNDYTVYQSIFGEEVLSLAWWQVAWFLMAFGLLTPMMHRAVNHRLLGQTSYVMAYLERQRVRRPDVQRRIDKLAIALFTAWSLLMLVAVVKLQGDALGFFAPYLSGMRTNPWSRGQIGGGFSALISLAGYLQLFLTAACGVVAALSLNARTRSIALAICVLAFPYYIFDRTRNTMLAAVMPGVLAYVLMRLRFGWPGKFAVLGVVFLGVNFWLVVVMANREGMRFDVAGALESIGDDSAVKGKRHEGLNMFEELAWIQHFSERGDYQPNWGKRYFAELVNPIPRAVWPNKPTIGLDYAVARGQTALGPQGEVTATISTGMIGQGVVNFGSILGPAVAAFLMALWVLTLARQDLLGENPGRIILYGTGTILTFNLGRDITLLVLYPFFFGLVLFHLWMRFGGGAKQMTSKVSRVR